MSNRNPLQNMQDRLERIGLSMPDLLVPRADLDLSRWAVNACDQHVHDRSYWDRAQDRIGDAPSSLSLILPEADLCREDLSDRIHAIHHRMEEYLRGGVLRETGPGFVVVHREMSHGVHRSGLLVAFDLEAWHQPDQRRFALQATERVVEERLPARLRIRENAALEIPHALALVDDPRGVLSRALEMPNIGDLYRASLAENAGVVEGALVQDPQALEVFVSCLESLAAATPDPMPVWHVGDGNHSLEAARRVWNRLRRNLPGAERMTHPGRHFLAELVPLQSPGLEILPVHRRIHDVLEDGLKMAFERIGVKPEPCGAHDLRKDLQAEEGRWIAGWAFGEQAWGVASTGPDPFNLVVADVLLRLRADFPKARIDYLHGWEEAAGADLGGCTIHVRAPTRRSLAQAFRSGEIFPPKSFSLGAPSDKRHYLEARRLRHPIWRVDHL